MRTPTYFSNDPIVQYVVCWRAVPSTGRILFLELWDFCSTTRSIDVHPRRKMWQLRVQYGTPKEEHQHAKTSRIHVLSSLVSAPSMECYTKARLNTILRANRHVVVEWWKLVVMIPIELQEEAAARAGSYYWWQSHTNHKRTTSNPLSSSLHPCNILLLRVENVQRQYP